MKRNRKEYRLKNRDKINQQKRESYHRHKEYNNAKHREYYEKNKDKCLELSRQWRLKNIDKIKEYSKENYSLNKDKIAEYNKKNRLHQRVIKYNLTDDKFNIMYNSQNGCCAICGKHRKLEIEHNHQTGKVRGLVCHKCNVVIGMCEENVEVLQKAIEYLNKNSTTIISTTVTSNITTII